MSFEEGDSVATSATCAAAASRPQRWRASSARPSARCSSKAASSCDPHPGNVLVRAKADGRPQLVLLDHGLYRELTPHFRLSYCRLWRALVRDADAIRAECDGWAIGSTTRCWRRCSPRGRGRTSRRARWSGCASAARRRTRRASRRQALHAADRHSARPAAAQMLLLLKTNDCLRHADRRLGAPINSFLITLRFVCRRSTTTPRRGSGSCASGSRSFFAAPRRAARRSASSRSSRASSRLAVSCNNFRWLLAVAPSFDDGSCCFIVPSRSRPMVWRLVICADGSAADGSFCAWWCVARRAPRPWCGSSWSWCSWWWVMWPG